LDTFAGAAHKFVAEEKRVAAQGGWQHSCNQLAEPRGSLMTPAAGTTSSSSITPFAQQLGRIYDRRFNGEQEYRNRVWKILVDQFFGRYVTRQSAVLDLGCGYGQFINHVGCEKRLAMDLNARAHQFLSPAVTFLQQDCSEPWNVPGDSLDLVFTSNFFEHLPTKESLSRTLAEAYRCLKPSGRLIAMGPNAKAVSGDYWDFFDHHLALTDLSIAEAMEIEGFRVTKCISRFLPYTMVRRRERPLSLVRAYLRLPFVWRWFGHQFLVVAEKPQDANGSSLSHHQSR
jgi:SAM-dependent methyltransferase